jgi:flagellar biosynthesis/type III secretory pathway chaperone
MTKECFSLKEILKEELELAQELLRAANVQQQALKKGEIEKLNQANTAILKASQRMNFLALKEQGVLTRPDMPVGRHGDKLTYEDEPELTQLKTNLAYSLTKLRNIMQENLILSHNGLRFHHLILSLICLPGQQKIYSTDGKVKEKSQVSQIINKTC